MRRRAFIKFVSGAVAWPLAVRAQQVERMRRIGVLMGVNKEEPEGRARISAFYEGLRALGWIENRNVQIDVRWTGGSADRIRADTADMRNLHPT